MPFLIIYLRHQLPSVCLKVSAYFTHKISLNEQIGGTKDHKNVAYADNFFLPFNLLAANTFLPPAVLILLLKP